MLRAKRINHVNVEESIYSGGIILGNTHPFILNKWNLAPYMHMLIIKMYAEDVFKFQKSISIMKMISKLKDLINLRPGIYIYICMYQSRPHIFATFEIILSFDSVPRTSWGCQTHCTPLSYILENVAFAK